MLYQILHENDSSFRIRLGVQQITPQEEELLSQILASHPQISGICIYPATAGVRIFFKGSKKAVLDSLRKIPYSNVRYLAEQLPKPEDIHVHLLPTSQQIIQEFRGNKKMNPNLKKRLGTEVIIEALMDKFLPEPLNMAYHAFQLLLLSKA